MAESGEFFPPKRRGLAVHAVLILALSVISLAGLFSVGSAGLGQAPLLPLLTAILALAPIPFLGYRLYALTRARYSLTRTSLVLRWGLRLEEIPLSDIEWMRMADDLTKPLGRPLVPLPGAVLGMQAHPDLGKVEFLASEGRKLLLVATATRVFAISPENPSGLLQAFARATELGSFSSATPRSEYPSFVLGDAWSQPYVRFVWLTGVFLNVGLFIWVTLLVPTIPNVVLGVAGSSSSAQPVPATQLFLLPVSSLALMTAGWLAGLYLYRWERERPLAFAVWSSSAVTAALFLLAVFFVVTTPV